MSSVSATRNGPTVTVRWTTPERTTDRLLIRGKVDAEVCREMVTVAAGKVGTARRTAEGVSGVAGEDEARPCSAVVAKAVVQPSAVGEVIDTLTAELAAGPPRLLAYRVQLKNAAGRTAGASGEVFAATGDTPAAVENFRAHGAKTGVVLEWAVEKGAGGGSSNDIAVELERTAVEQEGGAAETSTKDRTNSIAGLTTVKEPSVIRLLAGEDGTTDAGGVVDRGAEMGHAYSYTAWRVRKVRVGGRQLEVRSPVSQAVTVMRADTFAPDAPAGLVAVPGLASQGIETRPAIDLSWEPNDEPRVAGYRVYRRDADASAAWKMISGAQMVTVGAYRDMNVIAGQRYAYRVTAVGLNGMESAQSNDSSESAPLP